MIVVKQKNEVFRYCAGAAFLLLAIMNLKDGLSFQNVLLSVSYVITGVSFLTKKPVLAIIGGIVLLVSTLVSSLSYGYLFWCIRDGNFAQLIRILLSIAVDVLFIVLTATRKKKFAYAAAATYAIRCLYSVIFFHASLSMYMILRIASLVLAGFAYEDMPAKVKKAAPNVVHSSAADKIQRMENLHTLLEKGIITQEEFDAKKNQLLDL